MNGHFALMTSSGNSPLSCLPKRQSAVAFATFLLVGMAASVASAQALPAATAPSPLTGFRTPDIGGSLQYAVTASESLIYGYNGQPGTGVNAVTSFSGDLAYLSKGTKHPFSAVYSGGYLIGTSTEPSYPFQNLALSQVLQAGKWNFVVADAVTYLPQTPTSGLSGIPGLGDLGVNPVQVGNEPGLGILTDYQTRVGNNLSGTVSRSLTGKLSLQGTGAYSVQRFIGGSAGIDNDQVGGGGGLTRLLDARSSVTANYNYSHSSFPNTQLAFDTQGISFGYNRQLTRQLNIAVSAGPQRASSGNSTLSGPSTSISVASGLTYAAKNISYNLSYNRGISNGDGVVIGSRTDSVVFTANRRFGRYWNLSGNVGYNHSDSLPSLTTPTFSNNGDVAGIQATRGIGRSLSTFVQYTLQRQSIQGTAIGNNAFNGLSQVLGFGITYSPQPFLGRR